MERTRSERRMRTRLRKQAEWGRQSLLIIMAVSLINQLLLALNVNYHFLFSAAVPYYLNWCCAKLNVHGVLSVLATLVTLGLYVAYAACWLLSQRKRGWLAAGLGLYAADTLLLILFTFTMLENPASCILEILTHIVGLVVLWVSLQAAERLSRMPRNRKNRNKEGAYDEQHSGGQAVTSVSGKSGENSPV